MKLTVSDILLTLPTDLASLVLLEWICLRDLTRLDNANCNQNQREILGTLFNSAKFVLKSSPKHSLSRDFTYWINNRGIRVENFVFSKDVSLRTSRTYLSKFGQHIRSIQVKQVDNVTRFIEITKQVAQYCEHLKSFSGNRTNYTESLLEVLRCCPELRDLRLESCTDNSDPHFDLIDFGRLLYSHLRTICLDQTSVNSVAGCGIFQVNFAPALERLQWRSWKTAVIEKILIAGPFESLRSLDVSQSFISNEVFAKMTSMYSKLLHLHLFFVDAADTAAEAFSSLPQLKTLALTTCSFTDQFVTAVSELYANSLESFLCFDTSEVTGEGHRALLKNCPKLRTLCVCALVNSLNVGDMCLLRNLTKLYLDFDSISAGAVEVEGDKPFCVVEHCQRLEHIHLRYAENWCKLDFTTLIKLPHLRSVTLYTPENILWSAEFLEQYVWFAPWDAAAALQVLRIHRPDIEIVQMARDVRYFTFDIMDLPI